MVPKTPQDPLPWPKPPQDGLKTPQFGENYRVKGEDIKKNNLNLSENFISIKDLESSN